MLAKAFKKLCLVPAKTMQRYRSNLKRSSAIQQGLLNISVFLISLLLLSIITFFFVKDALSERMEANLQQNMTLLMQRELDDDWDEDDDDYEAPPKTLEQVNHKKEFSLIFPQRDLKLKENKLFRVTGYSTHTLSQTVKSKRFQDSYRMLVRHKAGYVFVVAENNDNDKEILEIVVKSFLLNALIASILTTLLVIYLANRSHRQIRRIEHVLQHAAQGDLQQRIGPTGKMNDLAHVGSQIDTMLSRLETSMSAMTDISANIAHELKTPISRLRHDLITALEQTEQGQDPVVALNDAYEESSHITETFDALLRIAQIEGGARRANFTELDLNVIISNVVDIYAEVAEDSGMSLSTTPLLSAANSPEAVISGAQSSVLIHGDKELLVQMLANLIENSIRYCPEGTAITIGCSREGKWIKLCVADNGLGIPESEREHVFQRLYRVDKSRTDKRGTGLGLSLVKAIVELHGAEVKLVDNQPGVRVEMRFGGNMNTNRQLSQDKAYD